MPFSRAIWISLAALLVSFSGGALAQSARPGIGPNPGTPVGRPLILPEGVKIAGPIVAPELTKLANGERGYECPDGSRFPKEKTFVQGCMPACNWAPGTAHMALPPGLIIISSSELFQKGLLIERIVVRVPGMNCNGNTNAQPNENKDLERKRNLAPKGAVWIPIQAYCINEDKNPTDWKALYTPGPVTTDPRLVALLKQVGNRRARDSREVDALQAAVYSATEPGYTLSDAIAKCCCRSPKFRRMASPASSAAGERMVR